jgi:hypothetical protein
VEGEDIIVGLIADFVVATPEDALHYAPLLDEEKLCLQIEVAGTGRRGRSYRI